MTFIILLPAFERTIVCRIVFRTMSDDDAKVSTAVPVSPARLCRVRKVPDFDGYGFNVRAESGRPGQFVHDVDERSPAAAAGLRDGDRIVEVNGTGVATETHADVVERIRAVPGEVRLLVVDADADEFYRRRDVVVTSATPGVVAVDPPPASSSDTGERVLSRRIRRGTVPYGVGFGVKSPVESHGTVFLAASS